MEAVDHSLTLQDRAATVRADDRPLGGVPDPADPLFQVFPRQIDVVRTAPADELGG
jgi:hypothetical protein